MYDEDIEFENLFQKRRREVQGQSLEDFLDDLDDYIDDMDDFTEEMDCDV